MKIVIAGAGKVGFAIALQMCAEGHDITLIDLRQDRLDKALNSLDVIGLCGNCSALATLQEAEAGSADLFIAATGMDEANLLSCRLAGKLGARHTVSILRNPEYMEDLDLLKEAMDLGFSLHPDYVAAEEISRVLQFPAAARVESFPDCEQEIVSFRIDRMDPPRTVKQPRIPAPSGFSIQDYSSKKFKMYDGPEERVTLSCKKEMVNHIIDCFGKDVELQNIRDNVFDVTVPVSVSKTFYSWLMQYAGAMVIKGPENVKQEYKDTLRSALTSVDGLK